jgi:very-short-patch-repair endonuclease
MGPEFVLLELAKKRYLVFTHDDALAAGVSDRTIRRRVSSGRWTALYRRVYVPAELPIGWEQYVMGACLACGPDAVASFASAEVIWDFADVLEAPHVSIPKASSRRLTGVEVHRTSRLDGVGARGFRVTHPMRTLVDLASRRSEETIERYLDDAHRRRLIAIERFGRYLGEPSVANRPGVALLRELVSFRDPSAPIASDLETIFFRLLRDHGLPLAVPQHFVETLDGGKFIDFAYPDAGLAIEVDGYAQRANRAAFGYDRARQNELEQLGWSFRRFTWEHVRYEPVGVACSVGRALRLRPVRWKPV